MRLWRETSARDTVCLPFLSRQFVMRSATSRSCVFFASRIFLRDLPGENTRTGTTVSAASGRRRASRRQTPRASSVQRRRTLRRPEGVAHGDGTPHSQLGEGVEVAELILEVLDRLHQDARVRAAAIGRQLGASCRHRLCRRSSASGRHTSSDGSIRPVSHECSHVLVTASSCEQGYGEIGRHSPYLLPAAQGGGGGGGNQ